MFVIRKSVGLMRDLMHVCSNVGSSNVNVVVAVVVAESLPGFENSSLTVSFLELWNHQQKIDKTHNASNMPPMMVINTG